MSLTSILPNYSIQNSQIDLASLLDGPVEPKTVRPLASSNFETITTIAISIITVIGVAFLVKTGAFAALNLKHAAAAIAALGTTAMVSLAALNIYPNNNVRSTPTIEFGSSPLTRKEILEIASKPLPQPPVGGIEVRLINFDHGFDHVCWLNSALIFIATNTCFDHCINNAIGHLTPEAEETRITLKTVIHKLRTGTPGTRIDPEFYGAFVRAVKTLLRSSRNRDTREEAENVGVNQVSADDFFAPFLASFNYTPTNSLKAKGIQTATLYTSKTPGLNKNVIIANPDGILDINISAEEAVKTGPIHIFNNFTLPSEVEVDFTNVAGRTVRNQPGWKEQVFINMPETINIWIHRNVNEFKCRRDIDLLPDGTVQVMEYREAFDAMSSKWILIPNRLLTYRVETAITHEGDAVSGHYVAYERNQTGNYILHNDMKPNEREGNLKGFKQASFLRLRQIAAAPAPTIPTMPITTRILAPTSAQLLPDQVPLE